MFDKVNMTITCTTETRERTASQPIVQWAGGGSCSSAGGSQAAVQAVVQAAARQDVRPTVNRAVCVARRHAATSDATNAGMLQRHAAAHPPDSAPLSKAETSIASLRANHRKAGAEPKRLQ